MAFLLALAAPMARAQDVATMGQSRISASELKQLAQRRPDLRQRLLGSEESFENTLREVLIQRSIVREAQSKGWDKRADIAEQIENARNAIIVSTYLSGALPLPPGFPGESEIKASYEQNKARLFTPWSFHLAQIFVSRPADKVQAETALKRVTEIAHKAGEPGADFAALAKAESEDEATKAKGGESGWVFEPSLLPELRALVQRLKPGEVSAPVPSVHGWHVVKLIESRPPAPADFDNARGAIVNELRARRIAELRQGFIDALVKKTPIKIDRAALGKLRQDFKK
ncbi:MAG: peptidyl-prolyl cis-trans isomerase [Burkholderiales bacterium]|nr:peptidyl-prolyl cis-trans isomerase [Burkholderiales bacterium]